MIGGEWYTAAELAELKLPGLSSAKRKVNDRAAADNWACAVDPKGLPLARRRAGRGGGYEYHVSLLPAAARADLARRGVAVAANDAAPASTGWDWLARQSDAVRAEAARRLAVLERVDALEAAGMSRSSAVAAVATSEAISAQTIWNWLKLIRGVVASDRLPALAPRRAGGGKEQDVDPDIWQALLSDYLRLSKPSWTTCIERTAIPLAQAKGVPLPHARTLWRKFEREVPPQVVKLRRDGEEALRRMLPAQIRSVADLHAMQLVNIDGHRCDVFVRWPDGSIARPMMVAIVRVEAHRDALSREIG